MQTLAGGWQFNGIVALQTGAPFTIFSNDNQSQQNSGLDRADLVGKTQTFNARKIQTFSPDPNGINGSCLNGETTGNFYFNPLAYDCANVTEGGGIPLFSYGDSGRNSVRGPGINNFDLSLFKTFKLKERGQLEFRTEFFNAFNHTQFLISGNSSTAIGFRGFFGQVTQARDPRIIQFALKLSF